MVLRETLSQDNSASNRRSEMTPLIAAGVASGVTAVAIEAGSINLVINGLTKTREAADVLAIEGVTPNYDSMIDNAYSDIQHGLIGTHIIGPAFAIAAAIAIFKAARSYKRK